MGLGRIAAGVATGGLSEAARLLGGKYDTMSQVPLETPEQRAARQLLLNYAKHGQIGGIKAGEDLGLSLGDFDMTGLEQTGLSQLSDLISGGMPGQYAMGDEALRDILNTSEAGIDKMFSPFKAIAEREGREASTALKRQAGFAGNLYSTDTVRRLGDVQARTSENTLAKLAELTNQALNRKTSAIPLAYQSAESQESTKRNRIADAMNYGQLQRNLNNQSIQAKYNEALRRRQEIMGQLDAASSVSGAPAQFGVPSVKVAQPNPYMDLLQLIVSGGARFAGARAGGA